MASPSFITDHCLAVDHEAQQNGLESCHEPPLLRLISYESPYDVSRSETFEWGELYALRKQRRSGSISRCYSDNQGSVLTTRECGH